MRMHVERIVIGAALVLLAAPRAAAPQEQAEERLVVGDQITFAPGYAVGDVTVTDVRIADFRVLPGREKLLLLGRTAGQTLLNLTDQRRALRTVLTLIVESREIADLREMLSPYEAVDVRPLGGKAVVMGTVDTKEEVEAIAKLAKAAGAQSLVTLAPGAADAAKSAAAAAAKPAAPTEIEFEVDILEANVAFESGSYATGVEPSGRRLHQAIVRVPVGSEGEIFVPVSALGKRMVDEVRDQTRKKDNPDVGIHMKLEPTMPSDKDLFSTFVLIETNVPVEDAKDTKVMRRARWELESASGEPFALAGAQLLAVPAATKQSGSKFGRVLRAIGSAARLPGVRNTPAREYTTGIPYYDRKKKTQLLALFKPRTIGTDTGNTR